jgi:CheY-like chemotaxis protein
MNASHPAGTRHILVADDDRNDFLLIQLAFQKAGLSVALSHVLDGQQAVDYLTASGQFKDRAGQPLPDLLLLDLKMPKMDGFDVLTFLRNDPSLQQMRVVVLSASQIQEDIEKALELGAKRFLTKPADFMELVEMARHIFRRWLEDRQGKPEMGQRLSEIEKRQMGG